MVLQRVVQIFAHSAPSPRITEVKIPSKKVLAQHMEGLRFLKVQDLQAMYGQITGSETGLWWEMKKHGDRTETITRVCIYIYRKYVHIYLFCHLKIYTYMYIYTVHTRYNDGIHMYGKAIEGWRGIPL